MIRFALALVAFTFMASQCFAADVEPEILDLAGIVTDVYGNPVANAEVVFWERASAGDGTMRITGEKARTRTDPTGRFQIKHVALTKNRVDYWLGASARGFARGGGVWLDTWGGRTFFDFWRQKHSDEAWIVLFPPEKLEGTVVDETGAPVSGAYVAAGPDLSMTTAADGKFAFDDAPVAKIGMLSSERSLTVSHPDFVKVELHPWNMFGPELTNGTQTVRLTHGIKLSGLMTDRESGKPLAGMSVLCSVPWVWEGAFQTRSDSTGRWTLRVPAVPAPSPGIPGQQATTLELNIANGRESGADAIDVRPVESSRKIDVGGVTDAVENLDFQFERSLTLHGTVKFTGKPIRSLFVAAVPIPVGTNRSGGSGEVNNGRFEIPQLDPGTYELQVTQGLDPSQRLLTQQVEVTDPPAPLELTIPAADPPPPAPSLHGTVRDASGKPAVLGRVDLRNKPDQRGAEGIGYDLTDLNGNYSIERLHVEAVRGVWAWDLTGSQAAAVQLPDGFDPAQPLDIQLRPGSEISGVIHDPDGKGLPQVTICLAESMSNMIVTLVTSETDGDGKYTLWGVPRPPEGANLVVEPQPTIDRIEHYNYTIAMRSVPTDLAEGAKLDGYDFTVDLSQPMIRVKADPEK